MPQPTYQRPAPTPKPAAQIVSYTKSDRALNRLMTALMAIILIGAGVVAYVWRDGVAVDMENEYIMQIDELQSQINAMQSQLTDGGAEVAQ